MKTPLYITDRGDRYGWYCNVMFKRMPWKRGMYNSYLLSLNSMAPETVQFNPKFYRQYRNVIIERLRLGPVKGVMKIRKLMLYSANMEVPEHGFRDR